MISSDTAQLKVKNDLPIVKRVVLPQLKGEEDLEDEFEVNGKHLRLITDKLPIGIALFKIVYNTENNPTDVVALEVNPSYAKMVGAPRKKILNKSITKFFPKFKTSTVDWLSVYANVSATGVTERFEISFPFSHKLNIVYILSPKKGYCVSAFIDVTQQMQIGQKNMSAEKMFSKLYETTQDGIMARDLEGKMLGCNRAYAKMLGYTRKELKTITVQQLLPEKWHERREKIIAKVLQTGRSIVYEREYRRRDGSIFPASVRTWRLTNGKGKTIGTWSIVREISEQKALQKDLEQHAGLLEQIIEERTKQLKDAERLVAIGQTAGMVGHDLRNPLQTIIGELYLAKKEVDALSSDGAKCNLRESIEVIEEQVIYMDKIVSDLQAFVHPIKIEKTIVNLQELINQVLTSIALTNNIWVQVQIQDNLPPISVDYQLLKRVLINLVTNAVQAMPKGGEMVLAAKVNSAGWVSVAVKDNGVGIAEEVKSQIFTPLFTTKPRGQGFGLAVCKRVIEAHGGTITFESTQGQGTKFTIQFPAN
ncbi:MAG: PAS domain S-box protein [Candidatus Bathyarchaeota archaeon]|nr:PAS domain S-box protein [Candidatus Bathyarchaeota archaeon]